MAIQDTLLYNEAKLIQTGGSKPVFFRYEATLHANGKDVKTMYVDYVDIYRNFINKRFDAMVIAVTMGEGTYQAMVAPYKANVELTLRKIPLVEGETNVDTTKPVYTTRYRATPLDGSSGALESNSILSDNPVAADTAGMKTVEFQLTDPVAERMRLFTFGGIFRRTKMADILRAVLGSVSQSASKDALNGIRGVDVAESVTDKVRNHVIIPHSTPFVNIPEWIHVHCGGIFSTGLGWFYQNGIWYVYPPYDTKRFTKAAKTLTVVNLQADRYPNPEKSYRVAGDNVVILSTSKVVHKDNTEATLMNKGNGVRFADASAVMGGGVSVEGNKATFNKAKNASEFTFDQRESGLNMVLESDAKITSNVNLEYSKLAARNGAMLQCTWENANIDELIPGMPAKILYYELNEPRELHGVLIGVDAQAVADTPGMAPKRYTTNAALTFFVERKRN